MSKVLRLENVVRMAHGGLRAVNGVSLTIREKERVAICGGPGSGKGTMMRLIAGMEPPSDGQIFVLDKAVHQMNANEAADFRNRNFGFIQRETGFMERLNIYENVTMPLAIRGVPAPQRRKAAMELMKMLGISHIAHACPAQLSVYEARVTTVARALIAQPKLLLLYEADVGLTEREAEQLTGTLNGISQFGDYTVLSFGVNTIEGLRTDRTIRLEYGKVQEDRP